MTIDKIPVPGAGIKPVYHGVEIAGYEDEENKISVAGKAPDYCPIVPPPFLLNEKNLLAGYAEQIDQATAEILADEKTNATEPEIREALGMIVLARTTGKGDERVKRSITIALAQLDQQRTFMDKVADSVSDLIISKAYALEPITTTLLIIAAVTFLTSCIISCGDPFDEGKRADIPEVKPADKGDGSAGDGKPEIKIGKDGGAYVVGDKDAEVVTIYPDGATETADGGSVTPTYGKVVWKTEGEARLSFDPEAAPIQDFQFYIVTGNLRNVGGPINYNDTFYVYMRSNNSLIDAIKADDKLSKICIDGIFLNAGNQDKSWVRNPAEPDFRSPQRINQYEFKGVAPYGPFVPLNEFLSGSEAPGANIRFDELPTIGDMSPYCDPKSQVHGKAGFVFNARIPKELYLKDANGNYNINNDFTAWIYFDASRFPNDSPCGNTEVACYELLDTYLEGGVMEEGELVKEQ